MRLLASNLGSIAVTSSRNCWFFPSREVSQNLPFNVGYKRRVSFLNCEVGLWFHEYQKDPSTGGSFLTRYTQCRSLQDLHELHELLCFGKVLIWDPIQSVPLHGLSYTWILHCSLESRILLKEPLNHQKQGVPPGFHIQYHGVLGKFEEEQVLFLALSSPLKNVSSTR